MAIKEKLKKETQDQGKELKDATDKAQKVHDTRKRTLDTIATIDATIDEDDKQAMERARDSVKNEAKADFAQNVEAKEQQAEARARETQSEAAKEQGKVKDAKSKIASAGGQSDYGKAAIAAAQEKFNASAAEYDRISNESKQRVNEAKSKITQLKGQMQS